MIIIIKLTIITIIPIIRRNILYTMYIYKFYDNIINKVVFFKYEL
jgi:hypothetical protein